MHPKEKQHLAKTLQPRSLSWVLHTQSCTRSEITVSLQLAPFCGTPCIKNPGQAPGLYFQDKNWPLCQIPGENTVCNEK